MSDRFFDELREGARPLRLQLEEFAASRMTARIRARIASPPTAAQLLARWVRPFAAVLSAIALAGTFAVVLVERAMAEPLQADNLSAPIEISAGGDVYSVNE